MKTEKRKKQLDDIATKSIKKKKRNKEREIIF